jgi:hypothetical protein
VDIPATKQDLTSGHGDDPSFRKEPLVRPDRGFVVRVFEDRQDDDVVPDIGVHIRAGQPITRAARKGPLDPCDAGGFPGRNGDWPRLVDPDDLEGSPPCVLLAAQLLECGRGTFELRVGLVLGPRKHHHARLHKAAKVVDVTVRLVLIDTMTKPDHRGDAEILPEKILDLRLRQVRVASLGEQALLRYQHRAFTIDVEGAAFDDERRLVATHAFDLKDLFRHRVVGVP